jgi:FtsP/CotA-like multicopper oxidase with cupredoxin domain
VTSKHDIKGWRPNRRQFLYGAGAFAAGGAFARATGMSFAAGDSRRSPQATDNATGAIRLSAAERPQALPCFGGRELPLWTFSDQGFLPVLRVRAGEVFRVRLDNALTRPGEHTTIHWHGIRVPNAQDGVPYLTQQPILPGEGFDYEFTPPDAGTFFFHTHCNTVEQLGRGLAGVLLVEGDESEPYDAELLIVLRDWAVGEDGSFGPFMTEQAGKAGTFGSIRSCNGEIAPEFAIPPSADVRLRILNVDSTRIMQLGVEGAECAVVAIDGNAVPPFPLKSWFTAPANRLDLVIRSPATGAAELLDYFSPEPVRLALFKSVGAPMRDGAFDPQPLRANPIPAADLNRAERQTYTFSAAATSRPVIAEPAAGEPVPAVLLDDLCLAPQTFWAINKRAWPGRDHSRLPPPLATLKRGASYLFELRNDTPHVHPIHIHGHTFTVLKSNKRELPVHHADTVLLQAKERIEVAFVADNPGDWMFHCHIIEHQETGMMSYLRVA